MKERVRLLIFYLLLQHTPEVDEEGYTIRPQENERILG